jgi:hypothetical protein
MAFPPDPSEITLPWRAKSTTARARRSETKGAKNEGGRVTPMSGAGRQKGDYTTAAFRTEDKYTDAASYTLKRSVLDKIEREALHTPPCLMPKLRVTIQGKTYWVIREEDGLALGLGGEDGTQ